MEIQHQGVRQHPDSLSRHGFIFDKAFFSQSLMSAQTEALLSLVFQHMSEGVFILNDSYEFVAVNQQFLKITRLPADDILQRYFCYHPLESFPEYHQKIFSEMQTALIAKQDFEKTVSLAMRGGPEVFVHVRVFCHTLADNRVIYIGFMNDVGRLSNLREAVTTALKYDKLTGLQNLDTFIESTKVMINFIEQSQNAVNSLVLLRLNIDKLQAFNESLGIQTTDLLICQFVERINQLGHNSSMMQAFSRFGGDNFAILLNVTDIAQAYDFLDKLSQSFELPFIMDGKYIYIRISVGVALYPRDAKSAENVIIQAETALKHARLSGGDDIVWFDKVQQNTLFRDTHLKSAFSRALTNSQIVPFFQPKVSFKDPHMPMFEALVRWEHPELGTLSPHEFLDEVLDGLSQPLFETIIQLSARQIIAWKKMGYHVKVCINIDARQLNNDRFIQFLDNLLTKHRCFTQHIEFELTEIARLIDKPKALNVIKTLRDAGAMIAIDDFGTGYASLSYLIDYPVDMLKIDRIFVQDIQHEPRKQTLVKAIVQIAHAINVQVIAEGVENQDELEFLKSLGCDGAQGYYYGKPMSAEAATQWLTQHYTADPAISAGYYARHPDDKAR